MRNEEIRDEIRRSGVHLWEVAEVLGINDGNFSRLLRKKLTDEKKAEIRNAIKIASEKEG